jgi:carboxymethylenebutenolidase
VTTAIAQFMRDLEGAWEAHREALLVRRDVAAALAPMAAEPSVVHIPAMTGASGRSAVERFYAGQVLPHLPGDLTLNPISRTVDRWRLGAARHHCPSSHRPGAMSSRAWAGPHEPGA